MHQVLEQQTVNTALVVIAAILLLSAFVLIKRLLRNRTIRLSYERSEALFTPAERDFLAVLDRVLGRDYRVFGKVRIADIATVKAGLKPSIRQSALNRIACKHFDYVVCRASDLAVVCVVELNDSSHATDEAVARDCLVGDVCRTIKMPLLVVKAQRTYSDPEIRADFDAAIART